MADFAPLVSTYLNELAQAANAPGATPELSLRTPLENLLKGAVQLLGRAKQFHLANEATTAGVKGRPDFILYSFDSPSGYIEAESIDSNLKKLTGSAKVQNDHYCANLDNFILTNHLDFHIWHEGKRIATASLPDPRSGFSLPTAREIHELYLLLDRYFGSANITLPSLKDPKDLAQALARRTRQLNNAIHFNLSADPASYLHKLKNSFEQELLPNLSIDDFADLYAQTVAYGLFAARCSIQNDQAREKQFDRLHATDFIPKSNPFLAELFQQITSRNLDADIRWITDDIANLLRSAKVVSVRSFGKSHTKREDPVIHFYESFLAAYDPKLREERGVYYTPEPVVSYIIRSVDEILKSSFGKKDGLADDSVKILDPATGTGTFLGQTILHIYESFVKKGDEGLFSPDYVAKKLIPRLFGFELMVAPYTIAHLKLHLLLKDLCPGYDPKRRLEVYLTNTLEPPQTHPELAFAEYISKENNAAAQIKANEEILVIIGNPPYSGISANEGQDIRNLLRGIDPLDKKVKQPSYYKCDGKDLEEKKLWLDDDYVKFIRFAQWRIDRTGQGVLGFITNNGFLTNPTFRGMRQALLSSFHEINIIDLHGNERKKEVDPSTGEKDQNVFEIKQGVCIVLAVRKKGQAPKAGKVAHIDVYGNRIKATPLLPHGKYHWLATNSLRPTKFENVDTNAIKTSDLNFHFFKPIDNVNVVEFYSHPSLKKIFSISGVGAVIARDHLAVDTDRDVLLQRIKDFASMDVETARARFKLGKDARDWKVVTAQADVNRTNCDPVLIRPLSYRPYDSQWTYYTGKSRGIYASPCTEVLRHLTHEGAFGLSTCRNVEIEEFSHVFAINGLIQHHSVSSKEVNYAFPLYGYPEVGTVQAKNAKAHRVPNFSEDFLKKLAAALGTQRFILKGYSTELSEMTGADKAAPLPYDPATGQYHGLPKGVSPEDIFHYIYAILHSPAYRERYNDFLKIDFPRIPLPKNRSVFEELIPLGRKLTALHLLDVDVAPELEEPRHPFPHGGSNTVDDDFGTQKFPGFDNGLVRINTEQHFGNVTQEVWTHTIGGYQPAEKWLKDRRGRVITTDDLRHYRRMLIAIAETRSTMLEIDNAISKHNGFPAAFA